MTTTGSGPSFQGLGVLPGFTTSKAYAVSGDGGTVVGGSYAADNNSAQACRWTAPSGPVKLGSIKDYPYGEAYAVNADGSVIGGTYNFTDLYAAFIWRLDGGIEALPSSNPNLSANTVQGLSADGSVAAGIAGGGFTPQAFRWVAPRDLVGLGDLTSVKISGANGVSADGGAIAGQAGDSAGASVAVGWYGAGLVELPLLAGSSGGVAFGISADGSTCVGSSSLTRDTYQATLWGPLGVLSLGDLPGGLQACAAYAASADGSRVVGFSTTTAGEEAFLWTAAGGMLRLQDVLTDAGLGPQLAGWTLNRAAGISYDGTRIAGYGTNPNGTGEAFLAVLP
jgi:probable HAF family extracellular repeat protein